MAGIAEQLTAGIGDIQFFRQPFKQLDPIALFDIGDHLADGGLGNEQLLGCQAHFARFSHSDENAQMANGHTVAPSLIVFYL